MNPNTEQIAGEEQGLQYLIATRREPSTGLTPVLCFLHGYDEGPPTSLRDGVTRHGPLRRGPSHHPADAFLIVAPQLPRRGDLWRGYADAVASLVRRVQAGEGGDSDRTYLTGFSFGGNGVFDLALRDPGMWAALWAVDPTRIPARPLHAPVWLSFGEAARPGKQAFVRALHLEPFAPSTTGDRVFLDEGADHVGAATLAYRDVRIYEWLLTKKRR